MYYKEMIEDARNKGVATEKAMFDSIALVDELLCDIKNSHPEIYWKFMRDTHAIMYGDHYDEKYAKYDIDKLYYTDKEGNKHEGEHWSKDEVVTAWMGKVFPSGTTDCDKWVAANTMYADMSKHFSESDILEAAYLVYFADEDYPGDGKIWRVMHS